MEEYLHYMKILRSQINDVEDQTARTSFEEQSQITTIQNLRNDLLIAKSETKRLKNDFDTMLKEKEHICSQNLERQRKMIVLETASSNLTQTLELVQRERVNLSTKLVEKSAYYTKVTEEINCKLHDQQEWMASYKHRSKAGEHCLVKDKIEQNSSQMEGIAVMHGTENQLMRRDEDAVKNLKTTLDTAKARFDSVSQMKSDLISEITKVKQSVELAKCRMNDFKTELREMDRETLEEEIQALFSDKSGETEYLQSLQNRIELLKGISHMVKCSCGNEYMIELKLCA